ncbi:MAG: methyltransferase domain-containing protein [SAR202 cluster bacterium]|jgi:SAM-dependent methyltransferase|nr:methyltransferase domain-containing protein [SAR202 cluster bacterium]MDP6513460.1 methyltransferase domain-containing protein [SAR202 cluster bacterium]MDP6713068.1 methyltransferase domain-containing protein [SAR202 cluster bacterium]
MESADNLQAVNTHWNREGLAQTILDSLAAAGKRLDALTIEDLAPLDQFHGGGMAATRELAALVEISEGARVLDAGGGLGGPARTLATLFGCKVTMLDLSESYVHAAEILTERIGLGDQVKHHVGNAVELPFDDGSFDLVWTQQAGMNISDKERLYEGFHRVLAQGGTLAFQEFMAGPVQPVIFPVMWARDDSSSFLRTPNEMSSLIENAGFRARVWDEITVNVAPARRTSGPGYGIQEIVMGDDLPAIRLATKRNEEEGRIVRVRAVLERF